ncbi:hypothetical protein [Mesorhizobium sp. B2-8-9]|uniref:hypothetical protein n=1 Tax=Mesorhizobium sp. B2-8-9 TaxID=2589899 RepID=UPI00112EEA15|nr:hypothetical protein [Mesorhizobium sp. B2-8-9]TPI86381.1 hypothetical protein FJ423_00730 [Mesorhizobium sp. B2-8-9]
MTKLGALPFIVVEGNDKKLWNVQASGDWSADTATGRKYAAELLNHMAETDNPGLLYHVAKAMGEGEKFTGIECGFFTHLAAAALAG